MDGDKRLTIPRLSMPNELSGQTICTVLADGGAVARIDKVNWPEVFPDNRKTEVYVGHDGKNLYLDFRCEGRNLMALTDADLGPVANDSCVEFFVSPDPSSRRYWNFEFNAIGRKNVSTRIERPEPRRLSQEELSQIMTFPSVGREPFDEKEGEYQWSLAVVIPLSLLGVEDDGKPREMRGNFYKCGAKTSSPHYLSWAPIETEKPDFHRPEFFGALVLA